MRIEDSYVIDNSVVKPATPPPNTRINLGSTYDANAETNKRNALKAAANDALASYLIGINNLRPAMQTTVPTNPYPMFGASGYAVGPGSTTSYGASGYGNTTPSWVTQMPGQFPLYGQFSTMPGLGPQATYYGASGFSTGIPAQTAQNSVPAGFASPGYGASGYSYAAPEKKPVMYGPPKPSDTSWIDKLPTNPSLQTIFGNSTDPATAAMTYGTQGTIKIDKPKAANTKKYGPPKPPKTHHPDYFHPTIPGDAAGNSDSTGSTGSGGGGGGFSFGSSYRGWGGGGGGGGGYGNGYGWDWNLINWNVR